VAHPERTNQCTTVDFRVIPAESFPQHVHPLDTLLPNLQDNTDFPTQQLAVTNS